MKNFLKQKNKGFTLLFSVLIATLVVAISATIISIALRQTILSSTSRESQYAFYAANTALECAYYWDTTNNEDLGGKKVFADRGIDSEFSINTSDGEASRVICANNNIITGNGVDGAEGSGQVWEIEYDGATIAKTTFYLKIKNQKPLLPGLPEYEYCAEAIVTKKLINPDVNGEFDNVRTTIETKGYNTCEDSPRRVERGLIQEYEA